MGAVFGEELNSATHFLGDNISACQVVGAGVCVRARARRRTRGALTQSLCLRVRRGRASWERRPGRRGPAGGGGDAPHPAEPVPPRWVRWLLERGRGHGHPGQSERSSAVSRGARFLSWGGGHSARGPRTSPGWEVGWGAGTAPPPPGSCGPGVRTAAAGRGLGRSRGRRARGTDEPGAPCASRPMDWGGSRVVRTRGQSWPGEPRNRA